MLAKPSDKAFDDEDWIFEIKWDGYRAIADLQNKNPQFYSRNGISFLSAFEKITQDFSQQTHHMVLDGEIVAYDEDGKPSFQRLQSIKNDDNSALTYQVFDLLWLNGHSTEELSLVQRKELLKEALVETDIIKYCDHIAENGVSFFKEIEELNLEGMIAKKADSTYHENTRSEDWLKIKRTQTEEAIICGFTAPKGSRKYFGALLLGKFIDGNLVYCGHTGTGFNDIALKIIHELLVPIMTKKSPFENVPKTNSPATWVQPKIVCEVKYTEITKDGMFRHPVFVAIRKDKDADEITSEIAENNKNKHSKIKRSNVKLTNSDKIYFPKEQVTKGEIIEYYQSISAYIIPHLKNRPLSLNRFPNGIEEKSFYQKDASETFPNWIKTTKVHSESTDKNIDYVICNDKETLAFLNNLGCIDFNPWISSLPDLDHPDYLVLDLDPSAKNSFDEVIETAQCIKAILDQIKIKGYCKTSGSSGMHIYLPMGGHYDFTEVKDFAHILMTKVQEKIPEITTLERSLSKRNDKKIYLDYLQNRQGQTLASVYSIRPKEGANVSMPLDWDEVKKGLKISDFNIENAVERIKTKGDLFKPVLGKGIDMMAALELL